MLFMGDVTEEELYDSFAEQAAALQQGGADAILVETFSAIDEASAAVKAAKENTNLDVICTFTFEKTIDNLFKTMMGVSIDEMVTAMLESGADIIGTNCGNGIEKMVEIIGVMKKTVGSVPLLVHSNAGLPILVDGAIKYQETPDIMSSYLPALITAGATHNWGLLRYNSRAYKQFQEGDR